MKDRSVNRYSVLIVSSSEQFNMVVKKVLPDRRFNVIEVRKSASAARRELLVREYDIVIINAPLQDGMGTDFVMDLVEKNSAGVLFAVPSELYCSANDHLIEYGVLTVSKPVKTEELERNIKLLVAMNDRLDRLKKKLVSVNEKLDENIYSVGMNDVRGIVIGDYLYVVSTGVGIKSYDTTDYELVNECD